MWFTSQGLSRKNPSAVVTLALTGWFLGSFVATTARAADPPAAEAAAPTLTAVAPAEFGAGATITVQGAGFVEDDVLLLDALVLEDVKVEAGKITATIPAKAKVGKKLHLRRGKNKLAMTDTFEFVGAPKLTSASPKFAAPGETVTFKGSRLAKVTALTLGGKPLTISEQTDKAIKATIPEGMQTGPVLIKSVGGEAGLKKDYEVFYARDAASVDPAGAVEGDAIALARAWGRSRGYDVRAHPAFGTAKCSAAGAIEVDLASMRHERYATPGALPTVAPGTLVDDLHRRDFTANAMKISV